MEVGTSWKPAPAKISIDADEVHVWRARLDRDEAFIRRAQQMLDDDERARAARFKFARDRDRFVVGRGILRMILSCYLGRPGGSLQFLYGTAGKPRLRLAESDPSIRFNLSHSQGLAAYAISCDREIGIDVEATRSGEGRSEIAEHYFSPAELAELRALPRDRQDEGFLLCWTRKEAYIKALGAGLGTIALDSFSVSLTPGEVASLRSLDSARWSLRSFEPDSGFVGAIVSEGPPCSLTLWDFLEGHSFVSPSAGRSSHASLQ